jgi:hypothetical protein
MAASKQEYFEWKKASPKHAILHKLHAEDISRQFGGLPRPIIMSWDDYDKYIHLNDLCAYDLVLCMLGMGVMLGQMPFLFDAQRQWYLAVGKHGYLVAEGQLDGNNYRVSIRPMTREERKQNG